MYQKNRKKKLLPKKQEYSESALDLAVNMVIVHKWPQKSVCQAYGIPRQVLCDKLRSEATYANRAPYKPYSPAAMAEAIRLVEEEKLPQSVAAMRCGIPKATLYCRIGKLHGTLDKKNRAKKTLTDKLNDLLSVSSNGSTEKGMASCLI